jgi:hypothetical protein
MAPKNNGLRDALSIRLQRIEDDLERLYSVEQTADVSAAIDALLSEAEEIGAAIAQIDSTSSPREKMKMARALRYRGMPLGEIAEKLGLSKTSVHRLCNDIPVDKRRYSPPRMTPPEWLEAAKSMSAEGKTRNVIAKELGIPVANFYRAFNRFVNT